MSKIKIMTDSTSDVPKEFQKELDITVVPIHIIDGDNEYLDGVDITTQEFYKILDQREKIPSSSRPSPMTYFDEYKKAWDEGVTDLIYVCINSKGSSSFSGANMELEDFYDEYPEAKEALKVHLIDSRTYSMGYGYAVISGAKAIKEGKSIDDVLFVINDWLEYNRILFVPLDLKCVKKSGRVSAAAAFVGDALGLKPVITFEDGESKTVSKIRGDKKVAPELIKMVMADRKEGSPYILASGSNDEAFAMLKKKSEEILGQSAEIEFMLGSVIAINAGPNVVGIIYKTK